MKLRVLDRLAWKLSGNGRGITIAILDSGFSRSHPALSGVAVEEARSFVGENPLVDKVGHGTECTSILVAQPGYGGLEGVAPAVTLLVGQIINAQGKGPVEALCLALEWVINLKVDVLAIPSGRVGDHPRLRQLVETEIAAGTVIVAPVGNLYCGQKNSLYPAAYPGVVSAGCEADLESYRDWVHPPDALMSVDGVPVCASNRGWGVGTDTSHATMLAAGFACLFHSVSGTTSFLTGSGFCTALSEVSMTGSE